MERSESIKRIKDIVDRSSDICVFTGAGISCPSGIPDFRSADGLYSERYKQKYSPETVLSHTFFVNHCEEFFEFYKSRMLHLSALPNKAHEYFAFLEKQGKHVSTVTQNIDGLHQAAGSTDVMELHGSVKRNYCTKCGKYFSAEAIVRSDGIPRCDEDDSVIKPDVVLYEEQLDDSVIRRALQAITAADAMFVIGTSLAVYPANTFVRYYKGGSLILINKDETRYDPEADVIIHGDIIDIVSQLMET